MTKQINGRSGPPVLPHCIAHATFNYQCLSCQQALEYVPGSDLTTDQKKAASALLAKRPMCVPGTRAIILEGEARTWHNEVVRTIEDLGLKPQQVTAFCDACGVAE
jgi:hypothetical protein